MASNTNPNWPSKTGNASGGGRGNNPPKGGNNRTNNGKGK